MKKLHYHNYTREQLIEAVKQSFSYAGCLRVLNIKVHRNMYTTLKNNIRLYNIDISHFTHQCENYNKQKKPKYSLEDILTNKIQYPSSTYLKKRLFNEHILEQKCYGDNCGLTEWKGKPISLQLEHIDGNHYNNALSNLTILCPNCHSQTFSYAGKNTKKVIKIKEPNDIISRRKFEISKEELNRLLWEMPTIKIAEKFGVTDKAIEKRAKLYELQKPPRGYWSKQKSLN